MNEREFARRVRLMRDRLWRVSFSILRSTSDSEDAMQEALLRAWRNVDSLRDKSLFETWLTRILINECKRLIRKRCEGAEIPESLPAPEAENAFLSEAIASLKMDLRVPIILYYIEGYSVRVTASIMRITQSSVKARLMRARKKLKEAIEKEAVQDE